MMHLVLDFLLLLPLVYAIRITVKECPVNRTAWQARAQVFECVSPEVYHCIQDDQHTLMETCMIPESIKPSKKGGCPWALYKAVGATFIAAVFNPCNIQGCPKRDDPEYWTNELYKYPICLQHSAQTKIPTTNSKTSKPLVLNITESTSTYTELPHSSEEKDNIPIILGVLLGLVGVAAVIFAAVWWYRRKISRQLRTPEVDKSKETVQLLPLDDQVLEDKLVENYQNATGCIPVIPLGKTALPLSKLFSPVVIEEDINSKQMQSQRKPIKKPAEIFFNDEGKPVNRIFMKGEAGRGKTVYGLKLSEEWCKVKQRQQSDMQEALSQFGFLFHVSMRHIEPHRTKVVDMIFDSLPEVDPRLISRVLSNSDIRCLVVLDGLDEWSSDSDKLPNIYGLVNCVLFTTSRPWKLEKLQIDYTPRDKMVEILGINPEDDETMIQRIVTNLHDSDEQGLTDRLKICEQRSKDSKIKELMKIPMMLTASCYVWCEEKTKKSDSGNEKNADKSMTYFSLAIIDMLIQRAEKNNKDVKDYLEEQCRQKTQPICTTEPMILLLSKYFPNIFDFLDILTPFCKVAYDDLMSKTTRLVFRKDHLEKEMGKPTVELALKVGFISQCWAPGKGFHIQNISVSFFHKLIQELMAAMHVVFHRDLLKTFCNQCDTMDRILGLSNVIMYLTGLNSELGYQLSLHIGRLVQNDQGFLLWRSTLQVENEEKVRSLYRTQCEWYNEMVCIKTLIGITTSSPYHVSDVCLVPSYFDSEAVRMTGELMSATENTVVSVHLWEVLNISSIVQCLPQHSTSLTALSIMRCDEQECEPLTTVITQLTQLQFIRYGGESRDADVCVVEALTLLSRLKSVELWYINLEDNTLSVSHMTQLAQLRLFGVYMSARNWGEFLSHLWSIQHKVCVSLEYTDIDDDSIAMIESSPQFKLDTNSEKRNLKFYKGT